MNVIKPPNSITNIQDRISVFLAGSIEMGKATDWQTRVTQELSDLPITILNPRRDDWDSSWEQSIDNPQFREQVEWELDGLRRADFILYYFDPDTKSPITLMELGLYLPQVKPVLVCCPPGYFRKGNVDITCTAYGTKVWESLDDLIIQARDYIKFISSFNERWKSSEKGSNDA